MHPLIIKIRSENSAEVAQLVEHHLAPKDKRFQPWQGKSDIGRLQMRKEKNSAEVAQLVEHHLAPEREKTPTLAREKRHRQTANA